MKKTIKDIRHMTGLPQAEFGKRLGGIPLRTIQNWENGVRTPPEWAVELIAFRVENDNYLLTEEEMQYRKAVFEETKAKWNEFQEWKKKHPRKKKTDGKLLGYDSVDGELVINTDEAEIVKFTFNKVNEYTAHPPKELVDRVLEIAEENGEVLTYEEAEQRVSYSAILNYIAKEMNTNEEFGEILKRNTPHTLTGNLRDCDECALKSEPIVAQEMWELAQKKMKDK